MNFSNACRLKKGLSLILIVLMVVGMFSGCKKNNSETEPNTTPSLNLNMSDTSAPTQETVLQYPLSLLKQLSVEYNKDCCQR